MSVIRILFNKCARAFSPRREGHRKIRTPGSQELVYPSTVISSADPMVRQVSDGRPGLAILKFLNVGSALSQALLSAYREAAKNCPLYFPPMAIASTMATLVPYPEEAWAETESHLPCSLVEDCSEYSTDESEQHPCQDLPYPAIRTADLEIIRFLGEGANGQVCLVKAKKINRRLAVKAIWKDGKDEEQVDLILKERELHEKLNDSPWFVKMLAAWHDMERFYIAMDVYQTDLDCEIVRCGTIEPPRARFYMAELIIALTELHKRGIIHIDIKTPNILIDREGHIVLVDFGLSKDFKSIPTLQERVQQPLWTCLSPASDTTDVNREVNTEGRDFVAWEYRGSPMEMAPEICLLQPYSFGVDFWSAGIVFYWMLTGRPPFYEEEVDNNINPPFTPKHLALKIIEDPLPWYESDAVGDTSRDLVEKMLMKEPHLRLCASEIPLHPYFSGIDWQAMERRDVPPPWAPGDSILHHYEPSSDPDSPPLFFTRNCAAEYPRSSDPYPAFAYTDPSLYGGTADAESDSGSEYSALVLTPPTMHQTCVKMDSTLDNFESPAHDLTSCSYSPFLEDPVLELHPLGCATTTISLSHSDSYEFECTHKQWERMRLSS